MEPGQMVTIKGHVMEYKKEKGFEPTIVINLAADGGGADAPNIPFHMTIRLNSGEAVMNTKTNSTWGKEEKKKIPMKSGEKFDIRIRAHADKFEIDLNGKDFHMFPHRSPLSTVTYVYIEGALLLHGVLWGGKYYPVPFDTTISGGLRTGKRLFISGVPTKAAQRLVVNLMTQDGDIALHFNPRFKDKVIVRNSCKGGKWENEEREGKLPFVPLIDFDIVFVNEPFSLQVYINDEKFCTFAHRLPPDSITRVQVEGDMELHSLMVL